jgi:serine/threonine protein kinase
MPSPNTADEFLELVRKSGVADEKRLSAYLDKLRASTTLPDEPSKLAGLLVRDGLLTHFQAEQVLLGKWRRFTIGKYKVLERLGQGGMGSVYLCEHKLMKRRVAVKVLPTAKADDPAALERFYREARAVAALDHPNIVRAYDIDQDEKLHFLVMEHVDGASLQEIIKKTGPMDVLRSAHYIRQAALGLQHAHEAAGLVHRDIKPGNILVDRNGIVKVLDMGLARFFHDEEDLLTKKYDESVLGTADYLAPEQAEDSHTVDIRADIYSLGATFYFCLTGKPPFAEGTAAQKLIWHRTRQPKALRTLRPEVPEGMAAVVDKMMAKASAQRYATPQEVADALGPWTRTPIPPPPDSEMPQLSPAAMGNGPPESGAGSSTAARPAAPTEATPTQRRTWVVPGSASPTPSGVPPTNPVREPRKNTPPAGPAPRAVAADALPATVVLPANRAAARPALQPAAPVALQRPAAPAPTPLPALPREVAEESPSWDKLEAPDTNEARAADTAPRPDGKAAGRSGRHRSTATLSPLLSRHRVWWVVGAVSAALVLLLLGLTLWAFFSNPTVTPSQQKKPRTLFVNPAGGKDTFVNLRSAVAQAQPNDIIQIQSDITETEVIVVTNKLKNLRIEGEPGKTVVWKCSEKAPPGMTKLLALNSVEGFELKNVILDGSNGGKRLETLVSMSQSCPGLTLENVALRGFQKQGVLVSNCQGSADNRVRFLHVDFATTEKGQSGIDFQINPKFLDFPKNQYIFIRSDCSFSGPGSPMRAANKSFLENVEYGSNARLDVP